MALQSYTIAVGNLQDDTSGNNYAVNKAVYILKQDKTMQPIFADFEGNTPITQDGVNNVTNNRGEFSFYVEPNDYIARVGGVDKAFTVVGSDYFNSKVDETVNLIIDAVAGRGAYYPVGSFEAGFTYTDINQVGTLGTAPNITYYVYTGGIENLPHTVTAGTDPTASGLYEQVFYVKTDSGNVDYKPKPNWDTSGLPYISVKEKLLAGSLDLVGDGRAPDDGTGDVSEAFKEFLEFGVTKITAPDGIFNFANPVVIHDKGGFRFDGMGRSLTTLTASSNLLLDVSELASLPIDYQSEYNKHAIFHVTAYDGVNDRPNKAARNTQFQNFSLDFGGTPAERVAALMASPQFAHAQFMHITTENALALAHFWITSGLDSRFYHLEFNEIESIDNVHHVKNDYKADGTALVSLGTTWQYLNNTIVRCDNGYEMDAINYGLILNSSVDNQKKGSYAYDINKCRGLSIISPGVESRLEQAGSEYGGGMMRIEGGSSVDISGGLFVGGDRDNRGTGDISDYGVPSMFLVDDSTVDWRRPSIDCQVSSIGDFYPIRVDGDGFLDFKQGYGALAFGGEDDNFEMLGSSRAIYQKNTGDLKFLSAVGASNKFSQMTNVRNNTIDEETMVAEVGDDQSDYDVLSNALDGTLKTGVVYRVNLGNLSLPDYTVINFPTATGPFGILELSQAGNYRRLIIDKNNGETWKNQYDGSSWSGWIQLG